jgi:hypothetical protein
VAVASTEGIGATIELSNCTVHQNAAGTFGGGVSIEGPQPVLFTDGTVISDNVCTHTGGGVHVVDGNVTATDTTIASNRVVESLEVTHGGRSYLLSEAVHPFSRKSGNTDLIKDYNAGLYVEGLPGSGGGLSLRVRSNLVLTRVKILHNSVFKFGGGMHLEVQTSTAARDLEVRNCFATIRGGGITVMQAELHLRGEVALSNNTVLIGNGGGLSCQSGKVRSPYLPIREHSGHIHTLSDNTVLIGNGGGLSCQSGKVSFATPPI